MGIKNIIIARYTLFVLYPSRHAYVLYYYYYYLLSF